MSTSPRDQEELPGYDFEVELKRERARLASLRAAAIPLDAQSPFLPGTNIQFAWDSTCLGYLKQCPRLYQYTIIDGWTPKDESVHLRFGSEYHQAIQEYDIERANGIDHNEAIRTAIRNLLCRTGDWSVDESTMAGNYKNRK